MREHINPDILVMTGAITAPETRIQDLAQMSGRPEDKVREMAARFPLLLQEMTVQEEVEFLDMEKVWESYLEMSGKPRESFMRDRIHANTRGMQVLARILARYLTPECKCGK